MYDGFFVPSTQHSNEHKNLDEYHNGFCGFQGLTFGIAIL